MSLQEKEIKIKEIELELLKLKDDQEIDHTLQIQDLENTKIKIEAEAYKDISAYDRVYLARKADRPNVYEYIDNLFDDFIELHGDRLYKDDGSIVGGLAMFNNIPCTVIGHLKGRTLEENLHCNFGMSSPEGYRKAMRLMKQAEKFNRPIITFVDTPGAYPGLKAEKHGIGEAIARNLMEMSQLTVPIIVIVIGEGGSGGALALSIGDRMVMLENSVYSVLSPEGFSSILWKDKEGSRVQEAAELMKLTAEDLYEMKIIDKIIKEPCGGITKNREYVYKRLRIYLRDNLEELMKLSKTSLINKRYNKFREMGRINND
ncbi:acetyl-CoA carboxylase carboxyltransferase subunit alpha [Thomasclavelia cocleata]|uniref:acetyl-CoA carboxylase carboxyltransferase subunit alpha n=1 Tax=Thomasclavelia cocleata TaxID=69824 RepID=UPI00248CC1A1|nr:acetyl-CoA carboxylase carboxyltransferase subunit alpha [Thomasclavelia cocleata]